MIDIEQAKKSLSNMIDEYNVLLERYKLSGGFGNWYIHVKEALTELERLQKRQKQFKNSKYVVIQDSVAKGYEFTDIKEAVDKLYSLKGNHEYDMGVLACVGGEQVFMIAERKLDWSDEK